MSLIWCVYFSSSIVASIVWAFVDQPVFGISFSIPWGDLDLVGLDGMASCLSFSAFTCSSCCLTSSEHVGVKTTNIGSEMIQSA